MERDLQDLKEDIRARSDIVEIIGGYTRLKRSGKNWTGLCPFHADKNPSFTVSPVTQFYRCWSCGEKGDVFNFIQKKENLDFVETLELLARRAGIPFERKGVSKEQISEREQMLELNLLAVRFYQDRLAKSQDAKDYLAQRGILKTTQEQWDLGFAPPEWEGLVFHLEQKRADLRLAMKAGLIKARQQEGRGYYDTFRNRVMFPIHDLNGRVIAFGGRAMSKEESAKYLNTEQTPLFDKSRTLYGLYFARKKLGSDTSPVFVEGYVDVITTHQAGFTQCVATLGTAMTEEHAKMLVRYNPRVLLCYDSDRAGINAALKGATIWESLGVEGAEARIARLPTGDDPDSLIQRGDTAAFQMALDNAVPRVDFQIELTLKKYDTQTDEGKDNALAEVIPILASISRNAVRGRYADRLAYLHPLYGRFGIERALQQILADVESYARQSHNAQSPRDRGYPLTEQANRAALNEQPEPPAYRPPNKNQWGQQWPMTNNVVRKGEYPNRPDGGRNGYENRYDNRNRRRQKDGPIGDPTPPPLDAPTLTGAEKAERQLLRALFSPEWRVYILARLKPDALVTEPGQRLFELIARTPANAEGGIDPLPLLHRAEAEENRDTLAPAAISEPDAYAETEASAASIAPANDPYADEDPYAEEASDPYAEDIPPLPVDTEQPAEPEIVPLSAPASRNSAKFSYFIREVLEDSPFLVSNDQLNEAAVGACIARLQKHRNDQNQRELAALLQRAETLPPDQRRAVMEAYQSKIREQRGSPPADAA